MCLEYKIYSRLRQAYVEQMSQIAHIFFSFRLLQLEDVMFTHTRKF